MKKIIFLILIILCVNAEVFDLLGHGDELIVIINPTEHSYNAFTAVLEFDSLMVSPIFAADDDVFISISKLTAYISGEKRICFERLEPTATIINCTALISPNIESSVPNIDIHEQVLQLETELSIEEIPQTDEPIIQISPNPFSKFTVIDPGSIKCDRVEIYDVLGNIVRDYPYSHTIEWVGDDSQGNAVKSGVYFIRFMKDDKTVAEKSVTLIK